jgi:hypothetical protein
VTDIQARWIAFQTLLTGRHHSCETKTDQALRGKATFQGLICPGTYWKIVIILPRLANQHLTVFMSSYLFLDFSSNEGYFSIICWKHIIVYIITIIFSIVQTSLSQKLRVLAPEYTAS